MKDIKELTLLESQNINGGKISYYANGVYCDSKTGKCGVDWGKARGKIGKIIVNGWVENGPWAHK